jgi:hypothetical protein
VRKKQYMDYGYVGGFCCCNAWSDGLHRGDIHNCHTILLQLEYILLGNIVPYERTPPHQSLVRHAMLPSKVKIPTVKVHPNHAAITEQILASILQVFESLDTVMELAADSILAMLAIPIL